MEKTVDRKRLLEQIESVTQNSDGRVKAIEVCSEMFFENRKKENVDFSLEIRKITRTSCILY